MVRCCTSYHLALLLAVSCSPSVPTCGNVSSPTWCYVNYYIVHFSSQNCRKWLHQEGSLLACSFPKEPLWRLKRLLGKYSILAQFPLSRHISFQKITSYQHNHVIAIFQAFSFCACVFYISVKSHPLQAIGTKLSWELNVRNREKIRKAKLMSETVSMGIYFCHSLHEPWSSNLSLLREARWLGDVFKVQSRWKTVTAKSSQPTAQHP